MSLPIEKRLVPSGITPLPWVARMAVQRLVLRDRQDGHWRHSGVYSGMTWSPFLTEVTPGPTSTTTPAPSWPRIAGKSPSGSAPESVNSSVWQIPVALISTITSPAFGPSSATVVISSGFPAAVATAARTSMALSPLSDDTDDVTTGADRARAIPPKPLGGRFMLFCLVNARRNARRTASAVLAFGILVGAAAAADR